MKLKPSITGLVLLAGVMLLGNCAAPQPTAQLSFKSGTPWREVAKTGGAPTVKLSYVNGGLKYDLATLENSPNPVVFQNSRLFAVLKPDAIPAFDRKIGAHLKTVELPFEKGMGDFHSWILTQRAVPSVPEKPTPTTPGDVAQAAAAGVLFVPIAAYMLAGVPSYATAYALSGGERRRGQSVNEALLSSGPSYGSFLSQFGRFDFHTEKGSYQIREYLATDGAFFTGRDFFYEVGLRGGKPLWVTYRNDAVRFHVVRYWRAHR
jgi:hypothetical protein